MEKMLSDVCRTVWGNEGVSEPTRALNYFNIYGKLFE